MKNGEDSGVKNNILTFIICSVCRTAFHIVRRSYLTFVDPGSVDIHSVLGEIEMLPDVQLSRKMQNSRNFYTFSLFRMSRGTSSYTFDSAQEIAVMVFSFFSMGDGFQMLPIPTKVSHRHSLRFSTSKLANKNLGKFTSPTSQIFVLQHFGI